ncbi:phosphotransferase family protein [Paecilomyces variotii No. 5]|uniref:Altered inheritance of mitochondria protein 9, mitochondrial n=1 Tax=Byssochlamys spectabilis (strain No. 5 / NBRC 109023) TaxID=1356009 RepID=V5G4E4_BYSSN|nr:phosphotransferase family protein [Paecilomyces variotii No. 5]
MASPLIYLIDGALGWTNKRAGLMVIAKMVPANEEDFYRYTTKRWLSNDHLEASKRYRKFNIHELIYAALRSSHAEKRTCINVMKYREGLYNKSFLITFDDGSEVVAKLPNPNAGPKRFTIASEVATMDYVHRRLDIPAPRVLSWGCDASNDVGCEYIIMEKAKGVSLGDVWNKLARPLKNKFIQQVVDMELKLASTCLSQHGCIYYTQNLPMEHQCKNAYGLPRDGEIEFSIGPIADPILLSEERLELDTSPGPWYRLSDYAISMGQNEIIWAKNYAKPRFNYYQSNTDLETPTDYMALIEKYLAVASYLTAAESPNPEFIRPTLWHSDLHLNNIYVDFTSQTISDIIDWQGATVAPLILQARTPRMREDKHYEDALCYKYYEVQTAKRNPLHYAAITHNDTWKLPCIEPVKSVCEAWSSEEVFRLRSSLLAVVDHWHELSLNTDCPITFTEEERNLHNEELENRDYIGQVIENFQEAGLLPADGIVDPQGYEIVKRTSDIQKGSSRWLIPKKRKHGWTNCGHIRILAKNSMNTFRVLESP